MHYPNHEYLFISTDASCMQVWNTQGPGDCWKWAIRAAKQKTLASVHLKIWFRCSITIKKACTISNYVALMISREETIKNFHLTVFYIPWFSLREHLVPANRKSLYVINHVSTKLLESSWIWNANMAFTIF